VWSLAERQHGVVARAQLSALGFTAEAIRHRLAHGRLHSIWPGVYAVGRPQIGQLGWFSAAVLTCGPGAMLSHRAAANLWEIYHGKVVLIDVTIPGGERRHEGIRVHRRRRPDERTVHRGIAVTSPARTVVDFAAEASEAMTSELIREADKRDVISTSELLAALPAFRGVPGVARLRRILDRIELVLADSELERRFLPLARSAGLPSPEMGAVVKGFRTDFFWPDLGLIVETDGLRYHRTPLQQARDRRRDQVHAAAGLTTLRFTHAQIAYERPHVHRTLTAVAARLRAQSGTAC